MEKTLNQLLELAIDFKELSLKYNGWQTTTYKREDYCVNCYFEEGGNSYFSVTFDGEFCFEINFFNPPVFEIRKDYLNNKNLKKLLKKYKEFYNQLEEEFKRKTEEEKERKRLERIKILEAELNRLKVKNK